MGWTGRGIEEQGGREYLGFVLRGQAEMEVVGFGVGGGGGG